MSGSHNLRGARGCRAVAPHEHKRRVARVDREPDRIGWIAMPKLKTHKGMKKRFKVSANGKVSHKRCGSSHLMSHKNGKQVRRLRKKATLTVAAEARRIRFALLDRQNVNADDVEAQRLASKAGHAGQHGTPDP